MATVPHPVPPERHKVQFVLDGKGNNALPCQKWTEDRRQQAEQPPKHQKKSWSNCHRAKTSHLSGWEGVTVGLMWTVLLWLWRSPLGSSRQELCGIEETGFRVWQHLPRWVPSLPHPPSAPSPAQLCLRPGRNQKAFIWPSSQKVHIWISQQTTVKHDWR